MAEADRDEIVEACMELIDANTDPGSRLLGMYYAAWQREFNVPVTNVALARVISADGRSRFYYFTTIDEARSQMTRLPGGGNFPDVE